MLKQKVIILNFSEMEITEAVVKSAVVHDPLPDPSETALPYTKGFALIVFSFFHHS